MDTNIRDIPGEEDVRRAAEAVTGTAATEDVALDGIAIERDAIADATELVAVCRA